MSLLQQKLDKEVTTVLDVGSLGSVDLSGLNFVLFEHLSVQGVSSDA
ncbi:hypothetical protein [Parashewanella spongiae]|nr:hypothetical protein [Parashewanella spongiae]